MSVMVAYTKIPFRTYYFATAAKAMLLLSSKIPFRTYYFATAAKAMLLLSSNDELITSCRSFRFGLYLFWLMVVFQIEMWTSRRSTYQCVLLEWITR
jgi:hypothetical protein